MSSFDDEMNDLCFNLTNPAMLNCPDEEGGILLKHQEIIKSFVVLVNNNLLSSGIPDLLQFLKIIKGKFNEHTELGKELALYNLIVSDKGNAPANPNTGPLP